MMLAKAKVIVGSGAMIHVIHLGPKSTSLYQHEASWAKLHLQNIRRPEILTEILTNPFTGPDSSSGRASASGSGGRRFDPRPRHTKGVKNGTGSSLADARNKRVVSGRYKKAGKYLLKIFVMSHNSS